MVQILCVFSEGAQDSGFNFKLNVFSVGPNCLRFFPRQTKEPGLHVLALILSWCLIQCLRSQFGQSGVEPLQGGWGDLTG